MINGLAREVSVEMAILWLSVCRRTHDLARCWRCRRTGWRGRGSGRSRTYVVVPSDDELDEGVDDVGSLVDTLDILDDDAPLPHKLVLCLVLLRELVFRFGLGRGCRQD